MEPFRRLSGMAASLEEDNVDTDVIFPARFLTITSRDGLGRYAFHDRGFSTGEAAILVAGGNFGCGSSREQAVWALSGAGLRCVIAPSFGEIFAANCLRNGMLPLVAPAEDMPRLHAAARAGTSFCADLEALELTVGNLPPLSFFLPEPKRQALLNGWDETSAILAQAGPRIAAFEQSQRRQQPWLYEEGSP